MAATKFSNDPLRPGFRLSRYSIVRRLSAGGFGVVYVARREDGKLVAIKEFLPSVIACRRPEDKGIIKLRGSTDTRRFRDGLEAFFREADTLAKIHDDRVIAVWDVFEANGTAYFAMPIEKGITLQAAIRSNPIPMSDAKVREIFIKACQGVEVLHQHGLLHLDLKPSNLWLRPDGSVVVLDLGASRWEDEEGRTGQLARTPGFAAPEQHGAVKVKELTVKTDVYGLAATLYATLEGSPPQSAPGRSDKQMPFHQRRLGQHSSRLLSVVDRGMQLNPASRWASAQEMRQALEKLPPLSTSPGVLNDGLGMGRPLLQPVMNA